MRRVERLYPKPLPNPACFYANQGEYPERLRASFQDGHVKTYWIETKQPEPHLITAKDRKKQYRENGGYQFRERKPVMTWIQKLLLKAKGPNVKKLIQQMESVIEEQENEIQLLKTQIRRERGDKA